MAFRKIIKTGDPDDIRTGFAGAVWDIVKMRRAGLRFRWCFWCFSLRSF